MVRIEANTLAGGIAVETAVEGKGGDIFAETATIVRSMHSWIREEAPDMEQDWVAVLKIMVDEMASGISKDSQVMS